MSEQGSQSSNDAQKPDSNTPDPDEQESYKPDSRGDVDPRPLQPRRRKHQNGKKLRKKNAQGVPQYNVSIVSARYDNGRHSWMYTLDDFRGDQIAGETEEKQLV